MAEINLQIAQAVRHDSIPMRTIAYITLVLLPGAFIAVRIPPAHPFSSPFLR